MDAFDCGVEQRDLPEGDLEVDGTADPDRPEDLETGPLCSSAAAGASRP